MKPQNKRKGRRVLAAAYHLSEAGPFVNQVILANMAPSRVHFMVYITTL